MSQNKPLQLPVFLGSHLGGLELWWVGEALHMGMAPLLQALRDIKVEFLFSRAIFDALCFPKHLLSAGKHHTGPVGDVLEEKLKTGG